MREPPFVLRDALLETCELLEAIRSELRLRDQMHAYAVLYAVLRAARQGMPAASALRMAAGMPLVTAGLAIQGWHTRVDAAPTGTFTDRVGDGLPLGFPVPAETCATGVLAALASRMEPDALASLRAGASGACLSGAGPHPQK
ncbi:DUF2267 domain-containing protein [Glycocaulis sp.]|uniref:DUF2267 domain-containing protein n=1 Tax=Glycocaulis sp. TaxID=1969725 RepID=UPI003F71D073